MDDIINSKDQTRLAHFFKYSELEILNDISSSNILSFLESIKINNCLKLHNMEAKIIKLTKRESECISHIAKGKTYKEVANILGIAYKTAEHHVEKAKMKTGFNFKSQLIDAFYKNYPSLSIE